MSGHLAALASDDDGSADARVTAALAGRAHGTHGVREVTAALAGARLLVPLLEVGADQLDGPEGSGDPCAGGSRAMAAVSMRTPQGSVGLAFTSMAALTAWNDRARPWPTPAERVAGAVLAEGGDRLVVDPGSAHAVVLTGTALARLARGEEWPEPWADPAVRDAVVEELAPAIASGELAVRLGRCEPGEAPDGLAVEVAFPVGTSPELARERASVVARRLAASISLRQVFDRTLVVRPLVRTAALG